MAETRKGFLIDTTRCIGCRSCQVACKQWNKLEADKTANQGSFENPRDLTPNLYNRIRFVEQADSGSVKWLFMNERCMHCGDAGCMKVCPSPGALYRTKEGIVAFNREKCISCKYCVSACPFNIPRYGTDDKVSKCNLCGDRVAGGMPPACAKACPTQSIQFGNRAELVARAKAAKKSIYGESDLMGLGVVYALEGKPEEYGLPAKPSIPVSIFLWKDVIKPLGILGFWGSVGAMLLHYVTIGPKKLDDETNNKEESHE
ncbi:4Fe-4S dicluster domain-containing protein [Geotalea uraniireducens]|uniref:Formate dehydrogenase (Quinone-dependent) iron-sulfur subunit n=1 Tax=Geotalea uraniireducens (strain Rf4) TaxID=351605 RepID=A5G6W2_GEOUR|nr:4Fe-4S dicluster domain-containing protein [Geotalea uraniireducens]ABQ27530.1 formate dehydrogenase (quinone-dependent) iron-sulfur subunit [Geotalea uraniireducens Rf4]